MFSTSLATVTVSNAVDTQALWALLTPGHTEVAVGVIVGLALLVLVEILAGLWLMRAGGDHRRVRR